VRVLTDYHHHALAESLLLLFEDRYGWEVFFPESMDWFTEDVWQFEKEWHGDAVAKQYLEGVWADAYVEPDGITRRQDPRHPWRTHRGLTLAQARDMRFDYVISSLPANDLGFAVVAKDTGAKFGVQVGNEAQVSRWDLAEFILSSSTLPGLTSPNTWARQATHMGTPTVIYHQEFDTDLFGPKVPPESARDTVASFVNCFPENREPYQQFASLADELRAEFRFQCYGAYGSAPEDEWAAGDVGSTPAVAAAMQASRTAWHGKYWSDGFGHVIHNWFSIGKPVVGVPRYYIGKLAGPLWEEGVTSIDVEAHDRHELVTILRTLRDDDELYDRMCRASHTRFDGLVDFPTEAEAIRQMLEGL